MSNKFLVSDKSLLLKNKLDKIATTIQKASAFGNQNFQTEEQYINEANKIVSNFYTSLKEPISQLTTISPDDLPSQEIFNEIWQNVLDDLVVIFAELDNIESLTISNFNFVITETNRLLSRLKNVSSKLGDYILFTKNPTKDSLFFTDSFNDLSKIEVKSSLLNTDECDVNQAEGLITLPIDRTQNSDILIKQLPIINSNSNGVIGNNQEIGAKANNDISVILDSNPDTWFEYENVVTASQDTKEPLILDITINTGDEKVINFIRVNPNNFGTKTVIVIDTIETSLDGKVFTSVKDDIPIAGFTTEDEANIFILSPSTSKFAGQGIYTFTPRKAKYIHFVFKQAEAYIVETPEGQKLRYAIGIRDIDIKSLFFKSTGELISQPFQSLNDIRKVLLQVNQNPVEFSELTSINYFISPDNGISWNPIQQKGFGGVSSSAIVVPEILNFNGPEASSINLSVPVKSIRLKIQMIRNDSIFQNGSSTLKKVIVSRSELHQIPETSPFTFTLDFPPVKDTLEVIEPLFGSRGLPQFAYIVGHGRNDQFNTQQYQLPFSKLPRPITKVLIGNTYHISEVPASEWMHVVVGGEEWTQTSVPLDTFTADGDQDSIYRLYNFDIADGLLEFGNGLDTMRPPTDSPIGIYFDAEKLFPSETPDNHIATLEFKTANNKTAFTIKRYDEPQNTTEIVSRKATILRLKNLNLADTIQISGTLNSLGFTTPVTYLNGRDELVNNTAWSIDLDNSIIYLAQPTPADRDISLSYSYQPILILSQNDWDWANTDALRDSVTIKDSAWKTIQVDDLSVPLSSGIKILDVANLSVVKGTLIPVLTGSSPAITTSNNPFQKEVDFIDGSIELGIPTKQTTERIPTLIPGVANIANFTLSENISNDPNHITVFDNTSVFTNANPALSSVGDYFIQIDDTQIDYGIVYVKLASATPVTIPGKVSYFYTDPNFKNTGIYSVDYKLGRIYLQRAIPLGDWTLSTSYQYTNFQAEYKIARILESIFFDIDITKKIVTIKDEEILTLNVIPKGKLKTDNTYYQVSYDFVQETREDISELKDYFSPVLKDYSIKVLTKDKIF